MILIAGIARVYVVIPHAINTDRMIMIAGIVLTVYVLMIGFLIGFWLLVKQKEKRLNDKTKKNKKNKLPRTPETFEKVIKFICDRRRKK